MIYWLLFYEFFKIGLFSFGGGLAMLPLMWDIISQYGWLTEQQFLDIIAISQVTPGPIAVNAATFIGYQISGVLGAILATFGSVLPSFIITLIIASIYDKIKRNPKKDFFFRGVKPVTLALITFAGVIIAKPTFFVNNLSQTMGATIIFVAVFLGSKYITRVNPIVILLAVSIIGIFIL